MKKRLFGAAVLLCAITMMTGCRSASTDIVETEAADAQSGTQEIFDYYAYEYDNIEDYVTLGEYKGLTYTSTDITVTDEDVDSYISDLLENAVYVEQIKDRAAAAGDRVNIDFEGTVDGQAFDEGSAQGQSLVLGAGDYDLAFENGITGMKPGDSKEIEVTYPADYSNEDLAGKTAVFTVTLNYIEGDTVTPELSDEYVAGLGFEGVNTVEEYREYMRQYLLDGKAEAAQSQEEDELFTQASANAQILNLPQELVDQYAAYYRSEYESYAAQLGVDLDTLLENLNMTSEDYEAAAVSYGEKYAGNMLVITAICKAEGFEVNDEVYAENLARYAEENADRFESGEAIEARYGRRYITQLIYNDQAIEILKQYAVTDNSSETANTEE